jgi:protocatechuate 3,4-dioxygenase beta subunit
VIVTAEASGGKCEADRENLTNIAKDSRLSSIAAERNNSRNGRRLPANSTTSRRLTMLDSRWPYSRRQFLRGLSWGAVTLATPALLVPPHVFAEELTRTPRQTEGPFYPDKLPLDTDNDLIIVNDNLTPAIGEVTHLSGKILDKEGRPLKNALVEIWQCDGKGVYLHTSDSDGKRRDTNFQGFGRFLTGSSGEYYFRTIKPVRYPDRPAPHIHFKVKKGNKELLTTQCYIKGHAGNDKDFIYRAIRDAKERAAVTIDFVPVKDSKIGELAAAFDIVLGVTPEG